MAYVSFGLDLTSSRRCEFGLCKTTDCPRCISIYPPQSCELTLSALGFAPAPVAAPLTCSFQPWKASSNNLARTIRHGAKQSATERPGCGPHTLDGPDCSGKVVQVTRPPSYRSSAESDFTSSSNDDPKEDSSVYWDCTTTEEGALTTVCEKEHDLTSKDNREGCCTSTVTPSDSVSGRDSPSCGSMVFDHLKVLLAELNIVAHSSSKHHIGWAFEGPFTMPKPSPEFDTIPYELTMPSLSDIQDRIDQLEAERRLPSPRQKPIVLRTFSSIPAWGIMPQVRACVTLETTPALPCPASWK